MNRSQVLQAVHDVLEDPKSAPEVSAGEANLDMEEWYVGDLHIVLDYANCEVKADQVALSKKLGMALVQFLEVRAERFISYPSKTYRAIQLIGR